MKVLFLSGREITYQRNQVIYRAFKRLGLDVITWAQDPLFTSQRISILRRSILQTLWAAPRVTQREQFDFIFIGFYGQLLAWWLGRVAQSPILFDAFISTFNTMCFDRHVFAPNSLGGRFTYWLDQKSCNLANKILLDTPEHACYFAEVLQIPSSKIEVIPVGCNEDIFYPKGRRVEEQSKKCIVLFYSTYQPLHGADIVVRAAEILERRSKDFVFRLVGDGPTHKKVRAYAEYKSLSNVTFVPPLPLPNLVHEIEKSDICLGGHFGRSPKADLVVPGKIYQILAMGKPLIAADTPPNRRILTNYQHALLCPVDDPLSLADSIETLWKDRDLRCEIARSGYTRYYECCSENVITNKVKTIVNRLLKSNND
jgi:glycosyltransferase involved in cell wall biosynthesis